LRGPKGRPRNQPARLLGRDRRDHFHSGGPPGVPDRAGLAGRSGGCRPRPHDLRHSFAVATLLDWYRDGGDIASRMPLLSAYLGHADPAGTYWYLHAAPELLAEAARRLGTATGDPGDRDRRDHASVLH
jgi:integrase